MPALEFAVSQLGLDKEQSIEDALPALAEAREAYNLTGLVVVPGMALSEGLNSSSQEIRDLRSKVEDAGLRIVGMQSLMHGADNAHFDSPEGRRAAVDHLIRQTDLARSLGARSLIFGSPKLRTNPDNLEHMQDVFAEVAPEAAVKGAQLCVEPLSGYDNEIVKTTEQGIKFVKDIGHPGVGLHLDAAAMAGAGETGYEIIHAHREIPGGIASFDASAPDLRSIIKDKNVPHREYGHVLRDIHDEWGFRGPVSVEVLHGKLEDPLFNGDRLQELVQNVGYAAIEYNDDYWNL